MEYETFLDRILQRAQLDSREEALQVVEAVLETLGERLEKTERENLPGGRLVRFEKGTASKKIFNKKLVNRS